MADQIDVCGDGGCQHLGKVLMVLCDCGPHETRLVHDAQEGADRSGNCVELGAHRGELGAYARLDSGGGCEVMVYELLCGVLDVLHCVWVER